MLRAGPYALLAGVAAYLALRWSDLPERFPIHWDARGEVNGWSSRSVLGVFGTLLVGSLICLGMELLSYAISHVRADVRVRQLTERILLATRYFLAVVFGALALLPLVQRPAPFLALMFPATALFVFLVLRAAVRSARKAAAGAGPDPNWKWGLFYVNGADRSVLVPKRFGVGFTLNFASPISWLLLVLLIAPALAALAFALLA